LRLPTHSKYFPLQCQTHYTVLQHPSCAVDVHVHDSLSCYHSFVGQAFENFQDFGLPSKGNSQISVVVEAMDQFRMVFTSMSNMYQVFHDHHF
jgi:hypothetical protein